MRLSFNLPNRVGGLDVATGVLVGVGVALIVVSAVAAMTLLPATVVPGPAEADPGPTPPRPAAASGSSVALSAEQVATVLFVDASAGAGTAARPGDRVDVLGYFSRQVVGSESVTRLLLQDVMVLTTNRSGPGVALTLAVPHNAALLLQEAQAIGARTFVTLRSVGVMPAENGVPRSFSDTDLADRLAGAR